MDLRKKFHQQFFKDVETKIRNLMDDGHDVIAWDFWVNDSGNLEARIESRPPQST